jgi:RNA polymerase sigma-70 factor (ECF subfamily)
MNETRQSLLLRAQRGEENAWKDLTDLYRPLILGWLNRQGVPPRDLEDLSQDILLSVVKHLPTFEHSGHRGAFRSWLRTIVCSRATDFWRGQDAATRASGGSGAVAALEQIADPDSDLNRQWDDEHDRYVLDCLLDFVEEEFEPLTLQAFRRLALEGAAGAEVLANWGCPWRRSTGPSRASCSASVRRRKGSSTEGRCLLCPGPRRRGRKKSPGASGSCQVLRPPAFL